MFPQITPPGDVTPPRDDMPRDDDARRAARARRAALARIFAALTILAMAVAVFSCSDKEKGFIPPNSPGNGNGNDTTRFTGFLITGKGGGALEILVFASSLAPRDPSDNLTTPGRAGNAGSPTVPAYGILQWAGGSVVLTGAYDFGQDTLYLAGAGRELRGNYGAVGNSLAMRGNATTLDGPGAFLAGQRTPLTWTAWCGPFHSADLVDSGFVGFVRADTTLAGTVFQSGATAGMLFTGSVSSTGSPKSVFFTGSLPTFYDVSGSGTLNETTSTAGGVYTITASNPNYGTNNSGTWTAPRKQ